MPDQDEASVNGGLLYSRCGKDADVQWVRDFLPGIPEELRRGVVNYKIESVSRIFGCTLTIIHPL